MREKNFQVPLLFSELNQRKYDYFEGYCPSSAPPASSVALNIALRELKEHLKKSQEQVHFLSQCKAALSNELLQLKKKESDNQKNLAKYIKESQELKEHFVSLSQENSKYLKDMSSIIEENRRLKLQVAATSGNFKLPHSDVTCTHFQPHPTYPWWNGEAPQELDKKSYSFSSALKKPHDAALGSWEEISQKLVLQMQREMKEMEELGQKLAAEASEESAENGSVPEKSIVDSNTSSDAEELDEEEMLNLCERIKAIKDENAKVKKLVLHQKTSLQKLVDLIGENLRGKTSSYKCSNFQSDNGQESSSKECCSDPLAKDKTDSRALRYGRPSDDTFRAYFTRQLQNSPVSSSRISEEVADVKNVPPKTQSLPVDRTKQYDCSPNHCVTECASESKLVGQGTHSALNWKKDFQQVNKPVVELHHVPTHLFDKIDEAEEMVIHRKNSEEEKICPMCQAVFPANFVQSEFENHVISHFETDNLETLTLLNQYELL